MNYIKSNKHIIMIILPLLGGWLFNLVLSWLINNSMSMLNTFMNLTWILSLIFIIFWIWVGKLYAELPYSKIMSFILGNLLWLLSFVVFLWQFVLLDGEDRSILLAGFSQHYSVFTNPIAAWFVMLSRVEVIDGTPILLISYILMLVIFSIGFMYGVIRSRGRT